MGMFKFLNKSKADITDTGLELPPVPTMDESGTFPEMKEENIPDLPDTSLPPLPTEMPGEIPPAPMTEEIKTPTANIPDTHNLDNIPPGKIESLDAPVPQRQKEKEPDAILSHEIKEETMPTKKEIEEVMGKAEAEMTRESKPEFPSMPEHMPDDIVPDDIPPLEGIPAPPGFETEPEIQPMPTQQPVLETAPPRPEHPIYITPDEPPETRRKEMNGPKYIRSDRFKAVLDDIAQIKAKFKEEDDFFFRINDIKSAQDQKFEDFRQSLEDVQRKLLFIDKTIFEIK